MSPAHPPRPSVQTRCGLHTRLWPPLAPQVTSHSFSQPWIALKPEMLGHPLPWTAATPRHLLQDLCMDGEIGAAKQTSAPATVSR